MKPRLLIFLLIFHLEAGCAVAQSKTGKVVGVKDGDTIEMLVRGRQLVVRLEGIDCPEKGQPFGNKAKQFTSYLVMGKEVRVEISSYDRFKRAIGFVYFPGGRMLNEELLRAGMAWHFKKYNRNPQWDRLEKQARKSKTGLWSEPNAIPPWEFRKNNRKRNIN